LLLAIGEWQAANPAPDEPARALGGSVKTMVEWLSGGALVTNVGIEKQH
jgi:hypothetical protein